MCALLRDVVVAAGRRAKVANGHEQLGTVWTLLDERESFYFCSQLVCRQLEDLCRRWYRPGELLRRYMKFVHDDTRSRQRLLDTDCATTQQLGRGACVIVCGAPFAVKERVRLQTSHG